MALRSLALSAVFLLAGQSTTAAGEIHAAVRSGNVAAVTALLDKTPALVNARDESGQTPLHCAAGGSAAALLSLLVERGAEVNARDNRGNAPLHTLASLGNLEGTRLLLDRGADIDIKASNGATPVYAAALGRQVEAIRLLAGRKANLEAADDRGRTPLVAAAREMRGPEVARALLDLGARIDAEDSSGDTALALAAWRGSRDTVDLLLARDASVPVNTPKGRQLLENAVSKGLSGLFRRMAGAGADLRVTLPHRRTLMHSAAEGGAVSIIGTLLDRQLGIDAPDANGWTPLHFAADLGRAEAVTFLLGKGANLHARTTIGQSAYNIAEDNNDTDMTSLLASKGADKAPPRFSELGGPYMGQKPPGMTPEVFAPGLVSARYGMHSNIVFSVDGTEAFWSLMIPARGVAYGGGRTVVSRLADGRWTYPVAAVSARTPLGDVPFFHPDGRHLYDMSSRALPDGSPAGKENIWVWDRGPSGWTNPRPIDASVNRLPHHWQFSVDRTGTLYFTSNWNGARGIFTARLADGAYQEPKPLGASFGSEAEFPFVSPDGSYLLFSRRMALHVSFRPPEGQWGEAVSLGPEFAGMLPVLSPDGKYLFFSRDQRAYWVDAKVIERLRPAAQAAAERDIFSFVRVMDDAVTRELWPGFNPAEWPIALYDGTRTVLLRHPAPPPEFTALPERTGVFAAPGRHPAVVTNSTREIGGVRTATVVATPAQAVESTMLAVVEEVFHVFWLQRHTGFRPNEMARYAYPVKDERNLGGLLTTNEALARGLEAGPVTEAARWAASALQFRRQRASRLTDSDRAFEIGLEMMEGTANYVARRAVGQQADATAARLRAARPAEGIRWRFYDSGAAVCYLLDRFEPAWKARIDTETTSTTIDLLDAALARMNVRPAAFSPAESGTFTRRAAAAIEELSVRQRQLRAELDTRQGSRIIVELAEGAEPLRITRFDPVNLLVLDAGEVVHPNYLALAHPTGTIEITNAGFARGAFGGTVTISRAAGRHPLADGIAGLTIVGMKAAPRIDERAGRVTVEADGVRMALEGARLSASGDTLTIRLLPRR